MNYHANIESDGMASVTVTYHLPIKFFSGLLVNLLGPTKYRMSNRTGATVRVYAINSIYG